MAALAHTANDHGLVEPLHVHAAAVAATCRRFGEALGCPDEAEYCGLTHDIGKLGDAFQIGRLRENRHRVDHWSAGAWKALSELKDRGVAAALAIQGHHVGLRNWGKQALSLLRPAELGQALSREGGSLSIASETQLQEWKRSSGLQSPEGFASTAPYPAIYDPSNSAASMLDIRMLFSALVDADYLETEAHFKADARGVRYARPRAPELEPDSALQVLLDYAAHRRAEVLRRLGGTETNILKTRKELLDSCLASADSALGPYTLSAPTGSGKTLAMLAFALRHARKHSLNRVVLAIPYLSIIEQAAAEYRRIFEPVFGKDFVLEDHSLVTDPTVDRGDQDNEDESCRAGSLRTENWDAPLVVTTSVQLLESLFSARPAACRKLHRLAHSVILFDEVQTLPAPLAVPTLACLAHLACRFRSTVVFATATQPAFSHLDTDVRRFAVEGWKPSEIVSDHHRMFKRAGRNRVEWPQNGERLGWREIAGRLLTCDQALCIVNLKRHALELTECSRELGIDSLYHLSTNMCPAHRTRVLAEIRERLDAGEPCRLIATQCVEAGVDLDFPVVYRALGPLDAIAQAAGRCNRNGKLDRDEAFVRVFVPENEEYPLGGYAQATSVTKALCLEANVDMDDPALFTKYYTTLYETFRPQTGNRAGQRAYDVANAIQDGDFGEVARLYKIIDQQAINVVVPYDRGAYDRLRAEADSTGVTRDWVQLARPHSVSLSKWRRDDGLEGFLDPVPLVPRGRKRGMLAPDWFFLLDDDGSRYDRSLSGLTAAPQLWIA